MGAEVEKLVERLTKLVNWLRSVRKLAQSPGPVGSAFDGLVEAFDERGARPEDLAADIEALLASSQLESSAEAPQSVLFVGWAALAPNGNVRLWSRDRTRVEEMASVYGLEVVRLVRAPLLGDPPKAIEALKTALGHIEHMSAWIAAQRGGYSFESLGEDMDDMRAPLNAPHAPAEARSAEAPSGILLTRAEARRIANYALMAENHSYSPFIRENGLGGETPWAEFLQVARRVEAALSLPAPPKAEADHG